MGIAMASPTDSFIVDQESEDGTKSLPSVEDLAAMPAEELVGLHTRTMLRAVATKADLDEAVDSCRVGGPPIPRDRFVALKRVKVFYSQLTQLTQAGSRRAVQNIAAAKASNEEEGRAFIAAARWLLTEEQYIQIWREANRALGRV
jgi:hypothetical protein